MLFDGGAVADADHDGVRQLGPQQVRTSGTPSPRRARTWPRRGRPLSAWPAGRGRTPCAAVRRGEDLRPVRHLVEPVDEMAQRHRVECPLQVVVGCARGGGIRHDGAQIAQRHVRQLRQEHRLVDPIGRRSVPEVNGHSCARLRNRVVLPLPDRPVITSDRRLPTARRVGRPAALRRAFGPRRRRARASHRCAWRVKAGSSLAFSLATTSPSRRMMAAR